MVEPTIGAVRVQSAPSPFGPTRQTFTITNDSKKAVIVYLERSGSECFRIPDSSRKLAVKPGRAVRAHVEFSPPAHGMAISLSATYRAAIMVWAGAHNDGQKRTLVDVVEVTGTAPGFVSPADLRCFDPTGSTEPQKPRRRAR